MINSYLIEKFVIFNEICFEKKLNKTCGCWTRLRATFGLSLCQSMISLLNHLCAPPPAPISLFISVYLSFLNATFV